MRELIVDSFAGGGGASTGIELAVGRSPDIAINHDAAAIAMHTLNHPNTRHLSSNIWQVDPDEIDGPIGLLWASPDCRHFSKAKGGQPVKKNIRDLAWVVHRWVRRRKGAPRVIILENVEEFQDWGPVLEDGMPCPDRKGLHFRRFVNEFKRAGYKVDWRELRASDYGAPTVRKRLFLIARKDGLPIVWPAPTHGEGLKPYRTAAQIIDWSLPCPSIFDTSAEILAKHGVRAIRPLADNTLARIAKGVKRYVLDAAEPFIVPITHTGDSRFHPSSEPLRTITCAHRGELALVTPRVEKVAAFLAQHNTDMVGHDARECVSTIVGRGSTQAVVSAGLVNLKGTDRRATAITDPAPTQTAGGWHVAEVRAFLLKYYGTDQDPRLSEPFHTATTKDRFGVITVAIGGEPYAIVDIGMRMLTPAELFRAQGFPGSYTIDRGQFADGIKPLTKTDQIRLCGNSVCPPIAAALVAANFQEQYRTAERAVTFNLAAG